METKNTNNQLADFLLKSSSDAYKKSKEEIKNLKSEDFIPSDETIDNASVVLGRVGNFMLSATTLLVKKTAKSVSELNSRYKDGEFDAYIQEKKLESNLVVTSIKCKLKMKANEIEKSVEKQPLE